MARYLVAEMIGLLKRYCRELLPKTLWLAKQFLRGCVWGLRNLQVSARWFWHSIPNYKTLYILLIVVIYAGYRGREEATVIGPFHLPAENTLPFGGDTVSNMLRDGLVVIQEEAEGRRTSSPCNQSKTQAFGGLTAPMIQVEFRPVVVEVQGISLEALISLARRVLHRERFITGDVILDNPNSFRLIARANDAGPWSVGPNPATVQGLQQASCKLAEGVLESVNPNVLGATFIRRTEYDKAVELYQAIPSSERDVAEIQNNFGVALRETKRYEIAIEAFNKALTLRKSGYPEAHYNLGVVLAAQGKQEEAIAEYRKAIELKPDYPEAHYNLGVDLGRGKPEEAIAEFRKAIELKPDDPEAHTALGLVLRAQGKQEEAIAEFRKAIELKPDYLEAHINLGFLLGQGKPEEAIAELRKAIELKADDPEVHYNLGVVFEAQGKQEEAIAEYRKAIELKPDLAPAHYNLAFVFRDVGMKQEAEREFEEAYRLDPKLQPPPTK